VIGLPVLLKKAPLVGAFFCLAFGLLPAMASAQECMAPVGLAQFDVARVVDGDTLRLRDGRSVRLIGINTPERGRQGRSDEPFAVQAQRRLQKLVDASDGRVGLQLGAQGKDRHQRTLAHAYTRDGQNIEARLLAEGLGWQVVVAPDNTLAHCQRQAEQSARQQRLGVWRESPVQAASAVSASGFAIVRGHVTQVEHNGGGTWIELDRALVLQVPAAARRYFSDRWLAGLSGREVEARGWVVDRARHGAAKAGQLRWMLRLTDPMMLQDARR